jgi:SNF2 family DNA or RNA helicase
MSQQLKIKDKHKSNKKMNKSKTKINHLDEYIDTEYDKKVKRLESVVKKLQLKLTSLKNALYDANNELCPVCMSDFENPTLVDCCAHVYCFNCLALTLNNTYNKCPVCQSIITKDKMHVVNKKNKDLDTDDEQNEDMSHILPDISEHYKEKIVELYNLVKSKKKRKFLIFADYTETFNKIEKVLKNNKINYGILKGSATKIKTTISNFQKGVINVIMLNAQHFGAGINLQCATDIIMYHRFTREMEEQIIGRGQRMGRKGNLNIYYLIHDNENNSFVKDNFNDISYQEYLNH